MSILADSSAYPPNVEGGMPPDNAGLETLSVYPIAAQGYRLHPVHPAWTDMDNLIGPADGVGALCNTGLGEPSGGVVDCFYDLSVLPYDAIINSLGIRLRWKCARETDFYLGFGSPPNEIGAAIWCSSPARPSASSITITTRRSSCCWDG